MNAARGIRNGRSPLWIASDVLNRRPTFKRTFLACVAFAAVSSSYPSDGRLGSSVAIWEVTAAEVGSSESPARPERPLMRGGILPYADADDADYGAGQVNGTSEKVGNQSDYPARDGEEEVFRYAGGNGVLPTSLDEADDDNQQEGRKTRTGTNRQGGSGLREGAFEEKADEAMAEEDDTFPGSGDAEESVEGDDDWEEPEHEEFDFQYHMPQQYRRVIPGTNIDYYDYVLMEERRARGEVDELPIDRSGLLPSDAGKPLTVVQENNGVFSYCYTTEQADLLERCAQAATLGVGVYIPIVNMTDFSRHTNAEIGNPAVQAVSIPPQHYKAARQDFTSEWFQTIAELKNRTRLRVGGLWFGPPDFDRMSEVLSKYPGLFDGFLVDWDSGEGACMSKLKRPPRFNRNGRQNGWWNKSFFMRYYAGGQDVNTCRLPDRTPYTAEPFVNNNLRGKILLNDTCAALGRELPPHDLIMAI
ncbi:conserved hypothetical protein [Neospora caninum Liverpool]|uniref:Uncharacterized protein n=1 Tax=Neospora caninum (strain Liverpool) TaxID=572307 RepID=F0VA29_NEOCL|nr:conserved hypothetical protein [Neospora caninum Liverpool]CBZ50518.1 conserved hypothetical protein [Neospora caninum Liverpool]CEL65128.1 TPA: hypothetical protein BN1204_009870 [Neospora caninum Liverpool]|eukprot:XP_003880551.1 conserved hypothetical protein [Neospora caninum Liverpool]